MTARATPHREAFEKLHITTFEDLPDNRTEAVGLKGLGLTDLRAPSDDDEDKYWGLICDSTYATIRSLLVRYVTQILPFPRELQGYWTLTAWPTVGGGHRYFTLSVRGTEVFFAAQNFGMVLREHEGTRQQLENGGIEREAIQGAPYAALRGLKCVRFLTTAEPLPALLEDPRILDDAYAVCRELMIHGKRGLGAAHNFALASDVLLTGFWAIR